MTELEIPARPAKVTGRSDISTDTARPPGASEPVSAECVAEKAARVREFFRDDWSRLRSLIMRLEEQSWQPGDGPSAGSRHIAQQADRPAGTGSAASAAQPGMTAAVKAGSAENSTSDQTGRLTELARMLEQRIRSATAGSATAGRK